MANQREMIEDYLNQLSLAAKDWIVVEPVYGDTINFICLQKKGPLAGDVLTAKIYLPRKDLEDLPPDQIKVKILNAISGAVRG